ncbi:MAG TPA: hypothetical protein VFW07_03135 [Parafilimonas sp.]|nr:hypothetical protein [Parafilimonas sp.]
MWILFIIAFGFFMMIDALKTVKKLVKGQKLNEDDIGDLAGLAGGVIGGVLMWSWLEVEYYCCQFIFYYCDCAENFYVAAVF